MAQSPLPEHLQELSGSETLETPLWSVSGILGHPPTLLPPLSLIRSFSSISYNQRRSRRQFVCSPSLGAGLPGSISQMGAETQGGQPISQVGKGESRAHAAVCPGGRGRMGSRSGALLPHIHAHPIQLMQAIPRPFRATL